LLTTALIGLGTAMPALAQNETAAAPAAAQDDSADGGTIVVTARRTEERLQDVPISITVFNQQQLSNRNVINSQDLARYTPSLSANGNFGSENSSFALRGFVQDQGTAPSVGVYFADVVSPRGASNNIPVGDGAGPGSFFDLQNVQVLKGPQGTLQGRNTTGGAVLLVPQKPTGKLEGYVEGSLGNYDMRRIQGAINVPVSDSFRVRLAVDHQSRDGYINNISGIGPRDFNDVNYTAVRLSTVADLTENLENYTIFSYSKSDTNGSLQPVIVADPAHALGAIAASQLPRQGTGFYDALQDQTNPSSKLEQWQVINTTTWKANDNLTVKNIISYAQLKDELNSPLFGTNFAISNPPLSFAGVNPIPGAATADQSTFTEELQLQGRAFDDRLTYQGGAYLEVSNPLGESGSQSAVTNACTDVANFQCRDILAFFGSLQPGGSSAPVGVINYTASRTRFHDVGLYAQATWKFNDKFKATGGFRYTWDKETVDSQLITYTGFPLNAVGSYSILRCTNRDAVNGGSTNLLLDGFNASTDCRQHLEQKSSAPTWLIDFDYTPTQDVLVYAKYARGYRTGTIAPTVPTAYNYIQPEKVDSYEVGVKTSFRSFVRGTFNVSGFYNDFSNQQIQIDFGQEPNNSITVSPTTAPANAGKSRIWGIEVEGSITPFTGFTIEGGYTHLNTEIRSVPEFTIDSATTGYVVTGQAGVGDPLSLSPKNKYTITANYTLPLNADIGKVTLGATFTHTDSQLSNYSNRFYTGDAGSNPATVAFIQSLSYLPATNLLNLNLSWNAVAGSPVDLNLFATNVTKEKYYTFLPGLAVGAGFNVASLGEPRMYGMRLKYHFGR
jgi:iron complex outermembrane receptor protein